MRILITGSRGYVGSRLCEMIFHDHKKLNVVGLDTQFYDLSKNQFENIFIRKDIRDIILKDLQDLEVVIHLASLSNDPLGELNKKLTENINFKATLNLARLAKKAKVKKFIFISTQSVYGISRYYNKTIKEDEKNIFPITEYAKSKFKAEKSILKLASSKFCVTILRPATVHGPSINFRSDIVLNNLCSSAFFLKKIIIKTDGKPYRPVLFIDDLCKIIIECIYKKSKNINKFIFNVGYPNKNFSIIEIAKLVKKVFIKSKIIIKNEKNHDERSYKVNFNLISKKFNKVLNFKNKNILEDIKKIKHFFYVNKFKKDYFLADKTNRISRLKKLIKEKKIDNNLRFTNV